MSKVERKKRIPVSGAERELMSVRGQDPNFHYRWVNKGEERVQKFLDAGYEPVQRGSVGAIGDTRVDTSAGTSSIVERGVGGGKTAMLMRIPKEFYEEDQAAKQRQVDDIETQIRRDAKKDRYGKLDISRGSMPAGE